MTSPSTRMTEHSLLRALETYYCVQGSPMTSPRAREVPAELKAKVKKVVAGHATGIKGSDFPREWEKTIGKGTPLKVSDVFIGSVHITALSG